MENCKAPTFVDADIHELSRLAAQFRAAIVACDQKSLSITLQCFPRGACGDAALLLAKYLEENGRGQFDYVSGEREGQSHAWLQCGDLIIDITGDQFGDQEASVIVTRNHSWHSEFNGHIEHLADFCIYDQHTVSVLSTAYEQIKKQIESKFPLT